MDNNDIPWDELFEGELEESTSNISTIMQEYCDSIKKSSGEKVTARYDMLRTHRQTIGSPLLTATAALLPHEEIVQENILSQTDINNLYSPRTYIFDIYNDIYQFRLCELTYGALYPIEIQMDEEVEEEIVMTLRSRFGHRGSDIYILGTDDELRSCFKLMIMTKKTKSILLKLRQS